MTAPSSSFNKNLQRSHMDTSSFTKEELKGSPKFFPDQREEDAQNTQQLQEIPLSEKPDAAESLSKNMEKNLVISEIYNQPIKKPDESNQEIKAMENSNINKSTELFSVKNLEIGDLESFESPDNSEINDESENTPVLEEIPLEIESQKTIQETKRPQERISGGLSANYTYMVTTINSGNVHQERRHLGDHLNQNQSSSASVISENPLCITQYNPAEPRRSPRKFTAMGDKRKNDLDEPTQNKRLNTSSGSCTSSPERCEEIPSNQLFQDAEEGVRETVSRLSTDAVNQEVNNLVEDIVNETGSVEAPEEGHTITDESVTEPSTSSNQQENNTEVKQSDEHNEACQDEQHPEFVQKSLEKIESVLLEVKELEAEMNTFPGTDANDRDYIYMDEVMMRSMIKLDNIDTNNDPEVRKKRKEGIQFIQYMMEKLDEKLQENKEKQQESRRNSQTSDDDHDDEEDDDIISEPENAVVVRKTI